jgi:NADH:ubiquinone oxidoreductase subunit 2 (subunit N)
LYKSATLHETDLKRIIAYSTVSQTGFIFLGLSIGNEIGFQSLTAQNAATALDKRQKRRFAAKTSGRTATTKVTNH